MVDTQFTIVFGLSASLYKVYDCMTMIDILWLFDQINVSCSLSLWKGKFTGPHVFLVTFTLNKSGTQFSSILDDWPHALSNDQTLHIAARVNGSSSNHGFGDDGCESHETSPVKSQVVLQVNYGILDTIYHVKTQNNTNWDKQSKHEAASITCI